ncbi:MAG: glycosyl transferase family 1 [Candidatus Sumerlaeia bacterium]|nr:glycosyl transferase family 1 [Candidatus Sumerlaeia bacterium]
MALLQILIPQHLCMCPRPQKEAMVLQSLGHEVVIRGVSVDEAKHERDMEIAQRLNLSWEFTDLRHNRGLRLLHRKGTQWLAQKGWRYLSHFTPELLGYGIRQTLQKSMESKADLTIAHGEPSLWVACELLKMGKRVGLDLEDWHSEDLLPSARVTRPITVLSKLEHTLLQQGRYRVTTSNAMAQELERTHGVSVPRVVYNSFPLDFYGAKESVPSKFSTSDKLRLVWFSQVIGPGRGLEELSVALQRLSDSERSQICCTLIGERKNCYEAWFQEHVFPLGDTFKIQPPVEPWNLGEKLQRHDVGLALETNTIRNRDLTITNKVFQYLEAGLHVIATPTRGQREVFEYLGKLHHLLSDYTPTALQIVLQELLHRESSTINREQIIHQYEQQFGWHHQAESIAQEVEAALK